MHKKISSVIIRLRKVLTYALTKYPQYVFPSYRRQLDWLFFEIGPKYGWRHKNESHWVKWYCLPLKHLEMIHRLREADFIYFVSYCIDLTIVTVTQHIVFHILEINGEVFHDSVHGQWIPGDIVLYFLVWLDISRQSIRESENWIYV